MHLINHFIQKEGSQDPVTISVIGAGGNGSHFLYALAALQSAMIQIRGQVFNVTVYDDDIVELHNCGRQLFFEQEIGMSKAQAIIERINRSYGYAWNWKNEKINSLIPASNIIVTCTDNIASRIAVAKSITKKSLGTYLNHNSNIYWIDMGNGRNTGNIILSTMYTGKNSLKTCFGVFPGMHKQKENDEPSCGMAEALLKQDLYINKFVATMAAKILKSLFTEVSMDYHGIMIDIEEMQMAKIPC